MNPIQNQITLHTKRCTSIIIIWVYTSQVNYRTDKQPTIDIRNTKENEQELCSGIHRFKKSLRLCKIYGHILITNGRRSAKRYCKTALTNI